MPQLSGAKEAEREARTPQRPDGPPGLDSQKATPAAVLSLATALPSVATAAAACTRLQLAEILDTQAGADRLSDQLSTPRQSGEVALLHVTLNKDPGFTTLGMDVKKIHPGLLRVDGIDTHGLVGVHNARQRTTQTRILEGDHIREINGVKENTEFMLAECKSKQQLMITLERVVNVSSPEKEVMSTCNEVTPVAKQRASQMRPDAEAFVPHSPFELEDRLPGLSGQHSLPLLSSPPGMDVSLHDFRSLSLHNLGNP